MTTPNAQVPTSNFRAYKPGTLRRRLTRRMELLELDGWQSYVDYLEVHPDEFRQLFNTILINVTGFFRDPAIWEHIAEEIVPRLPRSNDGSIRAWTAGCASGQEAYSLAMVFAERLGIPECVRRLKIYATDLDVEAIAAARQANYTQREVSGVPPALLAKYFEPGDAGARVFHRELRRTVIFGCHDLLLDPPISHVSLLLCRNTLMYFHSEAQTRILERLAFALIEGGCLVLGKAEMLVGRSPLLA